METAPLEAESAIFKLRSRLLVITASELPVRNESEHEYRQRISRDLTLLDEVENDLRKLTRRIKRNEPPLK